MTIHNEAVLILNFGGQYSQLIARRVHDLKVYCEIKSYKMPIEEIQKAGYKGVIFTGGPDSAYAPGAPSCEKEIFELGIPILGICYGTQLMAYKLGGKVEPSNVKEYGKTPVGFDFSSELFHGVEQTSVCWMSHTDKIVTPPEGFMARAHSRACPVVAMDNAEKRLYGVQFHPGVEHTVQGNEYLRNFLYRICGCSGDWRMDTFVAETIRQIKERVGDKKALCALSDGMDSSMAAVPVHKAIGKNLTCTSVDHGLLRKDEGDQMERVFREQFDMNSIRVNAQERFLLRLAGVSEPEAKRKIIGEEFICVFKEEAKKLGHTDYLCQGTIYPDVVESGVGETAAIKSHHNVGSLPENIGFTGLVEPLRDLFKDEVHRVGLELDIPEFLVSRQPFPSSGLATRVLDDITRGKLDLLREADTIFREEIATAGLDRQINQYFAVLTGIQSVGVMGDGRTYDLTVALRGMTTTDFMTADWAKIPYDVLTKVSNCIINEVNGVNHIMYDTTSKPPATIEWEQNK